ncbi:hypothetical protein [Pseudonocardia hydrocarbonoxydans]|jgi:hypothetical protein|uniref:Winged helix DNA-binding domain-containing protein n=1 Tax=Pseudonocardia hydrocarbonoxydans TaxID=76726 RepID=A0A4Y3WL32_9PSEU|nr:hypothetical protein [Pseudonocardia hydrocarbonoxydans]GEC18730.1 hypothetical protein PHY01_10130 [Pseudonocardia hydrocarbonoxydans]
MTTTHPHTAIALTGRDRSVLRAVRAGRCEVTGSGALVVDGIGCCDQFLGARLVRAGLIAAPGPSPAPARLTPSGLALLAAA